MSWVWSWSCSWPTELEASRIRNDTVRFCTCRMVGGAAAAGFHATRAAPNAAFGHARNPHPHGRSRTGGRALRYSGSAKCSIRSLFGHARNPHPHGRSRTGGRALRHSGSAKCSLRTRQKSESLCNAAWSRKPAWTPNAALGHARNPHPNVMPHGAASPRGYSSSAKCSPRTRQKSEYQCNAAWSRKPAWLLEARQMQPSDTPEIRVPM